MAKDDRIPVNTRSPPAVIAARKREIAQRYGKRYCGPVKDRVKALRRTQVVRLFKHRYGDTLPNEAIGRAGLQLLFELGIDGPTAQRLAPWADGDEIEQLISDADANWSWWHGDITAKLGERLEVTFYEKVALKLHHLACVDLDLRDAAADKEAVRVNREQTSLPSRRSSRGSRMEVSSWHRPRLWNERGTRRAARAVVV